MPMSEQAVESAEKNETFSFLLCCLYQPVASSSCVVPLLTSNQHPPQHAPDNDSTQAPKKRVISPEASRAKRELDGRLVKTKHRQHLQVMESALLCFEVPVSKADVTFFLLDR